MLIHLSTGAETTAKAVADFNRVEQQFVLEKGLNDLEEALPRHNPESFINFPHLGLPRCGPGAVNGRHVALD
eukprot:1882344-Prymnesium_polylepis.1